jgi:hypothetical protein
MLRVLSAGLMVGVAACASGASGAPGAPGAAVTPQSASRCAPIVSDSLVAGTPVYPPCGVGIAAKPAGSPPRVQYTPQRGRMCSMATVAVVVDQEGRVLEKTARLVRSNDPELTTALMASLPTLRYTPASVDGKPVAQIVEVGYGVTAEVRRAGAPVAATRGMRPRC